MARLTKEQLEVLEEVYGPDNILEWMKQSDVTAKRLVQQLCAELVAVEQKVFSTADGLKYSKKMAAWKIRQGARMDAHRLRGDYPAEKHELDIDQEMTVEIVKFKKDEDGDSNQD